MLEKEYTNQEKEIENIEEYYLSVITRYLGADPQGLIQNLENHNRSWDQWYPKLEQSDKDGQKSFFDAGAERVVYMLLNRGDILGDPNSNPVGSDNSFLKYDRDFKRYLAINIDVKAIKANTNFNDFIGNTPIGINQNSYKSNIEYTEKNELAELKHYVPNLDTDYLIEGKNYLNITYFVVILYCELPTDTDTPKEQRVISVITNCVPNGKLHSIYEDKVFRAGKTSNLAIKKGEQIELPNGEIIVAEGTENKKKLEEMFGSYEKYQKINGMKKIRWHVDARFNYKDIKFSTLEKHKQSRVKKIFLKDDFYNEFFYHVNENKRRKEPINRKKDTVDSFKFLENLPFF